MSPVAAARAASSSPATACATERSGPAGWSRRALTRPKPARRWRRSLSLARTPSFTRNGQGLAASSLVRTPAARTISRHGLRSAQCTYWAPASKLRPGPKPVSVKARPPMRPRASSTTTLWPLRRIAAAAARPAAPAPITATSASAAARALAEAARMAAPARRERRDSVIPVLRLGFLPVLTSAAMDRRQASHGENGRRAAKYRPLRRPHFRPGKSPAKSAAMLIRPARPEDAPAIWSIIGR